MKTIKEQIKELNDKRSSISFEIKKLQDSCNHNKCKYDVTTSDNFTFYNMHRRCLECGLNDYMFPEAVVARLLKADV